MKNIIVSGIIVFAVWLPAARSVHAQGTTYLSNLGQASAGSLAVGSNSWLAGDFHTGTNDGGYLLNSIQLGMADASGNPSGFTVMLYAQDYSYFGGIVPGSSLGTLNGSLNPVTSGIYTYTPASSLTLSPSTLYFIVLTAGTTVANGGYEWSYASTSSYNPTDNWGGAIAWGSSNGSLGSWRVLGSYPYDYPQYTINATAVPEPSSQILLGLGVLFLFGIFSRRHWISSASRVCARQDHMRRHRQQRVKHGRKVLVRRRAKDERPFAAGEPLAARPPPAAAPIRRCARHRSRPKAQG